VREEDEGKEKNGLEAFSWVQMQSLTHMNSPEWYKPRGKSDFF
jgi:hypothetical protein